VATGLDDVELGRNEIKTKLRRPLKRASKFFSSFLVTVIIVQFVLIYHNGLGELTRIPVISELRLEMAANLEEIIESGQRRINLLYWNIGNFLFPPATKTVERMEDVLTVRVDKLGLPDGSMYLLKASLDKDINKFSEVINQFSAKYEEKIIILNKKLLELENNYSKLSREKNQHAEIRLNAILSDLAIKINKPEGLAASDIERLRIELPTHSVNIDRALNSLKIVQGSNVKSFYQIKSDFDALYPDLLVSARLNNSTYIDRLVINLWDTGSNLGFYERQARTASEVALAQSQFELRFGHLSQAVFELEGDKIALDPRLSNWIIEAKLRLTFDETIQVLLDELVGQVLNAKYD